ncbi:MAG: hypothetical protein M0R66_03390 [Candidatus Omnitrophica bacterium]|nr:hypothetical protein [Candidatus Omnitrophota bacterium]
MNRIPYIILIILSLFFSGCSIPTASNYPYLSAYTREEKMVKGGFGKKKEVRVEDFREIEMYDEDIIALKEEVEAYISSHPAIDEVIKNNLRQLKVVDGMTQEETRLLLSDPDKIEKIGSRTKYGASERWIYKTIRWRAFTVFIFPVCFVREAYYLYFKDDILVGIDKRSLKQMLKQTDAAGVGPETKAQ